MIVPQSIQQKQHRTKVHVSYEWKKGQDQPPVVMSGPKRRSTFLVDTDVTVRRDTVRRVRMEFLGQPGATALFGSYDPEPAQEYLLLWGQA
jgi:hypothetical protein